MRTRAPRHRCSGRALRGQARLGLAFRGISHSWAWLGDWAGPRKRASPPPPPPRGPLTFLERPPTARYGEGLRGLIGAARQGAAQRAARPDVAFPAVGPAEGEEAGWEDVWNPHHEN
ncbi:hypothetical protein NN561_010545 [Cricetulus griseus]